MDPGRSKAEFNQDVMGKRQNSDTCDPLCKYHVSCFKAPATHRFIQQSGLSLPIPMFILSEIYEILGVF